jgi:uncharacterized protein
MQVRTPRQSGFRRVPTDSLPIYSAMSGDRAIFYAPRLVCVLYKRDAPAVLRHVERLASELPRGGNLRVASRSGAWHAAVRIVQAAGDAAREVTEASRQEFTPECLTLYVNNQCNMRCRYCYSQPTGNPDGTVSEEGVRAAARLVAGMCAAWNSPFTLAFHGGGEPTLDTQHVDRILDIAREEAGRFGLYPRTYIATNGAVSEETARWLAAQFDLVGVSCDGPPEVQDRHRPGLDGQPLSEYVGRTMSTLRRQGRPFHIRATISRETVDRQAEIVSYLADRYAPGEIRLEPVYVNPSGEAPLEGSHAAAFVGSFLAAQTAGAARGIPVTTSITRPDAVYGPYCNVLRRVLNLVPGDVATGCFLDSRPDGVARRGLQIGWLDSTRRVFRMDGECIRSLIARCSVRPVGCGDCLCSYQCTYGCPDRCALEASESSPLREGERGSFRCLVNRMLMEWMIREAADQAWTRTQRGHCQEVRDTQRMLKVAVYRDGQRDEVTP